MSPALLMCVAVLFVILQAPSILSRLRRSSRLPWEPMSQTNMTRGIRGTYVYVCDPDLRAHLTRYLPVVEQRWKGAGPRH